MTKYGKIYPNEVCIIICVWLKKLKTEIDIMIASQENINKYGNIIEQYNILLKFFKKNFMDIALNEIRLSTYFDEDINFKYILTPKEFIDNIILYKKINSDNKIYHLKGLLVTIYISYKKLKTFSVTIPIQGITNNLKLNNVLNEDVIDKINHTLAKVELSEKSYILGDLYHKKLQKRDILYSIYNSDIKTLNELDINLFYGRNKTNELDLKVINICDGPEIIEMSKSAPYLTTNIYLSKIKIIEMKPKEYFIINNHKIDLEYLAYTNFVFHTDGTTYTYPNYYVDVEQFKKCDVYLFMKKHFNLIDFKIITENTNNPLNKIGFLSYSKNYDSRYDLFEFFKNECIKDSDYFSFIKKIFTTPIYILLIKFKQYENKTINYCLENDKIIAKNCDMIDVETKLLLNFIMNVRYHYNSLIYH